MMKKRKQPKTEKTATDLELATELIKLHQIAVQGLQAENGIAIINLEVLIIHSLEGISERNSRVADYWVKFWPERSGTGKNGSDHSLSSTRQWFF